MSPPATHVFPAEVLDVSEETQTIPGAPCCAPGPQIHEHHKMAILHCILAWVIPQQ